MSAQIHIEFGGRCVESVAADWSDPDFPLELTVQEVFDIWHRVRRWQMRVDLIWNPNGGGQGQSSLANGTYGVWMHSPAGVNQALSDETELACADGLAYSEFREIRDSNNDLTDFGAWSLGLFGKPTGDGDIKQKPSGRRLPRIIIGAQSFEDVVSSNTGSVLSAASATFMGNSIPLFEGTEEVTTGYHSGNITIEPVQWWEYAGSFSSATGTPIT